VLPLYDDNPTRTKPFLTWALVALNVVLFLAGFVLLRQGPYGFYGPLAGWMLVPAELTQGLQSPTNGISGPPAIIALFTSMFLHGSWQHLLGNMLYLTIFGNNIEEALGRARYLAFYVICGIAAGLTQVAAGPASTTPMLGASGAIAGVLGAYLVLYPKVRVVAIPFPVPAWVLLSLWIFSQFFNQWTHALGTEKGGVAYFAHIGGFIAGMLLIKVLGAKGNPPREPRYRVVYPDEG
jgi:membrane associated rhomboid family serine protease